MANKIIEKDLGMARIRKELAKVKKSKIQLGVHGKLGEEEHVDAKVPMAELALWLHVGTPTIPARPWIDNAISELQVGVNVGSRKAISDLIDGREDSAEGAMTELAKSSGKIVVKSIDNSREWATPLAESTIKKKGHDQPLVDSGELRNSQAWGVTIGGVQVAYGGVTK